MLFAVAPTLYAQTFKVLYSFGTKKGDPINPSYPGIIAQSRGGNLFSTTGSGGFSSGFSTLGTAFKITTGGNLTVLHRFNGADGAAPWAGLTLATDGQYYGATDVGGIFSQRNGNGTVFKMTQHGTITTLYKFQDGADGYGPLAPPVQSVAGEFYGTTASATSFGVGSVYKVTKYGDFTLLHSFKEAEGATPIGPLVQGTDYFFYGTAEDGGKYGHGTIFRISSSGDFKVLFNFDGTHGAYPVAGLIQANDGNYYGVASGGGSSNAGVVFKMTSPGYAITVLHNFDGINGLAPAGGLVQATDGNLYGTTACTTPKDCAIKPGGILFRLTLAGKFTVLHAFSGSPGDGDQPLGALIQHTNGILYGATFFGGTANAGTFFSMDVGLKPFVTYLPTYGRVGATVQILGQGFSSNSTVSFNGVPATFTEVYPTYLKAFVPGGATSGPITVTTANGTLTSNKVFIVHRN
jgi:uncharacterized repeat protein (TIGR03803 family)